MLASEESLLPGSTDHPFRALTLGVDERPDELNDLLRTLKISVEACVQISLRKVSPSTYVGRGKLEELRHQLDTTAVDFVVFDLDLSPTQIKQIESILEKRVLDRAAVILEIFSQHAQTKEAKTQVELAKMRYLLPRLTHYWSHFERQRGGGLWNKGMGEKQVEVDRRLVQKKIKRLEKQLESIKKERALRRVRRKNVLKVALVGYTNAGKSTLLNQLTHSDVLVEDQLFATLDSCVRSLDPNGRPPVLAIDTVGFIDRIPTFLIASFRSTLEEAHDADLLLHILDASSDAVKNQFEVTCRVLKDLGLEETPCLTVLNKMDLVEGVGKINHLRALVPGAIRVSAYQKDQVLALRDRVMQFFSDRLNTVEIMIPYSESKLQALIYQYSEVEVERPLDQGVFYRVKIDIRHFHQLGLKEYQL